MHSGFGSALIALSLATTAQADPISTPWQHDAPWFGGWSGIDVSDEVTAEGRPFTAVSDRGHLVTGTLRFDAAGQRITITDNAPLRDTDGGLLSGPRSDSEDLAIAADGTIYISFEGEPRVQGQRGLHGQPFALPNHSDFATLPSNRALEALAIDTNGALFALPEGGNSDGFPVYRLPAGADAWQIAFTLPRDGRLWMVTSADFGQDGRLYVLERALMGIGFRSRIRSMASDGTDLRVEVTTALGQFGNLEGLSIWQDGPHRMATMVADDNFSQLFPSQIVTLTLD
ncbi:hypothetical protein BVG79_02450 [Ketogulonicigenium robustum]|uniref:Phytase-like domain-containing protein n=1 Tax=Ketogulonicigenium robustum TaxID=92947 RepID=A0A1W6P368_9RHOB|nr:esterase-like activity of phytase family protein [Ketogulonicigenium robustum]ARO15790.1 hypothetical protein BVG79_02450 [Ketogulonicigenium robustum]